MISTNAVHERMYKGPSSRVMCNKYKNKVAIISLYQANLRRSSTQTALYPQQFSLGLFVQRISLAYLRFSEIPESAQNKETSH